MNETCIVTFTSRSVSDMLADGGSKAWVLDPKRASESRYLVCAWNARGPLRADTAGKLGHGEGFLVAPITAIEPVPPNRFIIRFREFARIGVPKVWSGHQNPVWYVTLAELGIHLDELTFARQ